MGKRQTAKTTDAQSAEHLFAELEERKRRKLFLPRMLAKRAEDRQLEGPERDIAHATIIRWADMERAGQLAKKETSIDTDFLGEVFGALGYRGSTESPEKWEREKQFYVTGVGPADGAAGFFTAPPQSPQPLQ